MPTPTQADLDRVVAVRDEHRAAAEALCQRAKAEGRDDLAGDDLRAFDRHLEAVESATGKIAELREDIQRGQIPERLRNLGAKRGGPLFRSAGALSPLTTALPAEELRSAYDRARRGETVSLETRAFASGMSLLPAELYPQPTFPIHEGRLLDRLPGFALDAPSLEYVQVNSKTGAAAIVGEGAPKPEITLPATKLICPALKLACHAGISWENMLDFEAFTAAVNTELMRDVIDLENDQLWGGDPAAGGLNSLTKTAGILTHAATGTTEYFTDLAAAIAVLRTGPALAEPDLCLMHPNTWAVIRTAKDQYGRFLASVDPTDDQAESVWGVDVLVSTRFAAGEAVLVDTTKVGRVAVREPLGIRIGYSGTDFTDNIVRTVCEERLNFAIERPAAIVHVTGLPATAPAETKSASRSK